MGDLSARNFGLLIAYVIPGCIALWGLSAFSPIISLWVAGSDADGPKFGGVLYFLLASIAAGMTANGIRWLFIDSLLAYLGVRRPPWDDRQLMSRLDAYQYLIEIHYRFYQFYANSLVSLIFSYVPWRMTSVQHAGIIDLGIFILCVIFFIVSRDTLKKYHARTTLLLGITESEFHHGKWRSPRQRHQKRRYQKAVRREEGRQKREGEGEGIMPPDPLKNKT